MYREELRRRKLSIDLQKKYRVLSVILYMDISFPPHSVLSALSVKVTCKIDEYIVKNKYVNYILHVYVKVKTNGKPYGYSTHSLLVDMHILV